MKIYLPAAKGVPQEPAARPAGTGRARSAVIVLVEDDPRVRKLAERPAHQVGVPDSDSFPAGPMPGGWLDQPVPDC